MNCTKPFRCANCGGEHECTAKNCPAFVFKSEVIKYQTRERCGYPEAETKVREEFAASGKVHMFRRWRQTVDPPPQGPTANATQTTPEDELRTRRPEQWSDPNDSIARNLRQIRSAHPTPAGATIKQPSNHNGASQRTTSGGPGKGNREKSDQDAEANTTQQQSTGAGNPKGTRGSPSIKFRYQAF